MVRSAEVLSSSPSIRWRIPLLIGLLMCWVTPAAAQVEIRVVDSETGVALPDAQVEVVRNDGERVVAEPTSDGGFSVPAAGAVEILVTSYSYLPRRVEVDAEVPQVIEMTPSPLEVDQITVTATRTATPTRGRARRHLRHQPAAASDAEHLTHRLRGVVDARRLQPPGDGARRRTRLPLSAWIGGPEADSYPWWTVSP